VWAKIVDSPIPTSKGFEPTKPKSKLKTKTGLVEKGGTPLEAPPQESSSSEQTELFGQ